MSKCDTVSIIDDTKAPSLVDDKSTQNEGSTTTTTIQSFKETGYFGRWWSRVMGDIHAKDDPQQLSSMRKHSIIFMVAVSGLIGPTASFIYMPGANSVKDDMYTSLIGVNATVAVYALFLGIAPLFWAGLSDAYGRKPMYIMSLIIYIVGGLICTFSTNVGMLIVFRALQACGGGAGQTLGGGVIADIYHVSRRGRAYGIFCLGPLFGPIFGPTIGGALCEFLGWRSTLYFLAIIAAVLLVAMILFLPETLRLEKTTKADTLSNSKQSRVIKNLQSVYSPMIVMLHDPNVLIITFYNTIIFSSLFFINPTITDTFQTIYHYNSWQVGLCYLLVGAGLMIGSLVSGQYSDYVLKKYRKEHETIYPEMRLRAGFPSFIFIPTGLLIYGWSTQYAVGVYAPFIGLFFSAFGQMCGTTPTSVYLVDAKPGRSASALAIHNFVRYFVSAIVCVFSTPCLHALGPGVLFSILSGINLANIGLLVMVIIYGRKWRIRFEEKTGTGPAAVVVAVK